MFGCPGRGRKIRWPKVAGGLTFLARSPRTAGPTPDSRNSPCAGLPASSSCASPLAALAAAAAPLRGQVRVASPDGRNQVTVEIREGRLSYSLARDGRALILPSLLGFEFRGRRRSATGSASPTPPGSRTTNGGPSPGARWPGCATTTTSWPSRWRRPRPRAGGSSSGCAPSTTAWASATSSPSSPASAHSRSATSSPSSPWRTTRAPGGSRPTGPGWTAPRCCTRPAR